MRESTIFLEEHPASFLHLLLLGQKSSILVQDHHLEITRHYNIVT